MSEKLDKRVTELYNMHCEPDGSLNPNLWYSILFKAWCEIERPRIIRGFFNA